MVGGWKQLVVREETHRALKRFSLDNENGGMDRAIRLLMKRAGASRYFDGGEA